MEYQFTPCKCCGATLRLPKIKGQLEVTCPKCKYNFRFYSSEAKQRNLGFLGFLIAYWRVRKGEQRSIISRRANATFNIIKSRVDYYFRAVALIDSATNHACNGISYHRECIGALDNFKFTARFEWMAGTLKYLAEFLTHENKRIEQEFRSKTNGIYGTSDAEIRARQRAWKDADKERQRLQDLVDDEFFKAVLGQFDTVSNRRLVGSPFHCFASSRGEYIIDGDWWVIVPGGEDVLYKGGILSVSMREPENRGYKTKHAVPALKKLMAQHGLNVPITWDSNSAGD